MILIHIGFGLMALAMALALYKNRRLLRELTELRYEYGEACHDISRLLMDHGGAVSGEAVVREISVPEDRLHYFEVLFPGDMTDWVVMQSFYNPDDPSDRERKRVHAEEVAHKLNEKP